MRLTEADLASAWRALDSAGGDADDDGVELVAVGNPHLSLTECARLAELVSAPGGPKSPDVSFVVTMGREVHAEAEAAGHIQQRVAMSLCLVTHGKQGLDTGIHATFRYKAAMLFLCGVECF